MPSDRFGRKAIASRRFEGPGGGLDPEEIPQQNYLDRHVKIQAGCFLRNSPEMEISLSEDKPISSPEENIAVRSGKYLWLLLLLVPCFSTASFAQSDRYNVIQLETLPEVSSMARGLNNS